MHLAICKQEPRTHAFWTIGGSEIILLRSMNKPPLLEV